MAYKESLKSHPFNSFSITDQNQAETHGTLNTYLMLFALFINAFVLYRYVWWAAQYTATSWMWACKDTVVTSEKSIIIHRSCKNLGILLHSPLFSCVVIQLMMISFYMAWYWEGVSPSLGFHTKITVIKTICLSEKGKGTYAFQWNNQNTKYYYIYMFSQAKHCL